MKLIKFNELQKGMIIYSYSNVEFEVIKITKYIVTIKNTKTGSEHKQSENVFNNFFIK